MADTNVVVNGSAVEAQSLNQAGTTVYQETVTIGDGTNVGRVAAVDSSGRLQVMAAQADAATGTITSVAPGSTSTTLLASNSSRFGYRVYNDSNVDALVSESSAASSSTSYTYRLVAGGFYESPLGAVYTGALTFIGMAAGTTTATAATSGSCRVTELT
ncbi:MAG: hypothetical protein ACXVYY_01355 [Oryzihumus sp.]